jgi:glutathione S-transferase
MLALLVFLLSWLVHAYLISTSWLTFVKITAAYCGQTLQLVDTHPSGPQAGFRDEPYASNFPFGKVPGFSHGDFYLAETAVILPYLAALNGKAGLLGKGVQQRALIEQWVCWGTNMAFPTLQPW